MIIIAPKIQAKLYDDNEGTLDIIGIMEAALAKMPMAISAIERIPLEFVKFILFTGADSPRLCFNNQYPDSFHLLVI